MTGNPGEGWKVLAEGDDAEDTPLWRALARFRSDDLDEGRKDNAAIINRARPVFRRYYNAAFLVSAISGVSSFLHPTTRWPCPTTPTAILTSFSATFKKRPGRKPTTSPALGKSGNLWIVRSFLAGCAISSFPSMTPTAAWSCASVRVGRFHRTSSFIATILNG